MAKCDPITNNHRSQAADHGGRAADILFQQAGRTLKNGPMQGRSKRMVEAYFTLYAADLEPCENEAEDVFQRSENKKSPRPKKDPEDCTRFFILTCSPALEEAMV
jgi:hypothetical protein